MTFANVSKKVKMDGADLCTAADSMLGGAVRFSISQKRFIFCVKD